eukprot:TRINITY_DN49757_c0_g1_i1.p1 TRINITY_DN49757_c0_g1~~TRINITY_DN49757_c0_g1_i1.p1  ORF type:complete len:170 (-),score=47.74 TRINITY_DN49757_c0_g1_i1:38-547(-)
MEQSYEQALAIDEQYAQAWFNLGCCGGGTVKQQSYSNKQCYQQALAVDGAYSKAWDNLSNAGGGRVSGREYSKAECRALAMSTADEQDGSEAAPPESQGAAVVEAEAWYKLGVGGGGSMNCLLYTSDAADEEDSVDLGGRRIIKKKKKRRKGRQGSVKKNTRMYGALKT